MLSKRLTAYSDVDRYLRLALLNGSRATLVMKSHGACVNWRQRAYRYRDLLHGEVRHHYELNPDLYPDGPKTEFDDLVISIEDNRIEIRSRAEDVLEFIAPLGVTELPIREEEDAPAIDIEEALKRANREAEREGLFHADKPKVGRPKGSTSRESDVEVDLGDYDPENAPGSVKPGQGIF
jgi:hypothetical protein